MPEIEIQLANMVDYPLIRKIDLGFESNYVWKSQIDDDLDAYTIVLQKIKLPKTIHVPFQAGDETALENMVKRNEVFVARYEKQVIGFVHLDRDLVNNRIEIKTGGVKPEYRRKGIGTAILNGIQEMARQNEIARIVMTVQAKNDPAIRFLMSKGYQFCGYQEFFFPNLEIALFFSKNIR